MAIDPVFNELTTEEVIGPVPVSTSEPTAKVSEVGGLTEAIPIGDVNNPDTVVWTVMNEFDAGMRAALKVFIDTTKDGVLLAPTTSGRSKIMLFQFTGTPSSTISPGEIGVFIAVFRYPPGLVDTGTDVEPPDPSTL